MLGGSESFAGTLIPFQVGISSLGGIVFFRVGLCTPLRTVNRQYLHDAVVT